MTPTGYATVPRAVIARINEIGPVAFAVFGVLAGHADEAGTCWPSLETIARMIGRNTRTIRSALRTLEADGLIEGSRRRRDTTVYRTLDRQCIADQETPQDRQCIADQEAKTGNFRPLRPATSCRENVHQERTSKTKKQDRKQIAGQGFDPLAVDLPFDSKRFRQSWSDFAEQRAASKHPLSKAATARILSKLAGWGEAKAVEAIDTAIENGWRGVFEPRSNGKPTAGERKCRVPTDEELANWTPYGGNGHAD